MKTSKAGLEIIKRHEGLRLKAYRDPIGVWTIGYGHTSRAGAPEVHPGMVITQQKANAILRADLAKFEKWVAEYTEGVPLTQNQFDALVSFTFNVGPANFEKSTLRKKLLAGDIMGAANEFPKWRKAGGQVFPGLVKRRAEEKALFLSGQPVGPMEHGVELDTGKPLPQSTTVWTTILQSLLGNIAAFSAFDWKTALVIAIPITIMGLYIIRERKRHAREGMV